MFTVLLQLLLIISVNGNISGRNVMAFPPEVKSENGFDLEFLAKNAAIEKNRQRTSPVVNGINHSLDQSFNPEFTSRPSSHLIPLQNFGATPGELRPRSLGFPLSTGNSFPGFALPRFTTGSFPQQTSLPNFIGIPRPAFPTPGSSSIIPLGGLPEVAPKPFIHPFMASNFVRNENRKGIIPLSKGLIEKENSLHWPMRNCNYEPDFYDAMMIRLPTNYNYNRWWPMFPLPNRRLSRKRQCSLE